MQPAAKSKSGKSQVSGCLSADVSLPDRRERDRERDRCRLKFQCSDLMAGISIIFWTPKLSSGQLLDIFQLFRSKYAPDPHKMWIALQKQYPGKQKFKWELAAWTEDGRGAAPILQKGNGFSLRNA